MMDAPTLPSVTRFVAIGDSQTEGLYDYDEHGRLRGWADRFAERLALQNPELRYANLAIRGKRAADIREEQLGPALQLEPDLASVVAGVNDVVGRDADIDEVVGDIEAMYAALAGQDCIVMSCTFPLPRVGLTRRLSQRLPDLNAAIREAATRQGVLIVDLERVDIASDPRLYSPDRIHLNPDGHARLAAAFEAALSGATDHRWKDPLPPLPPSSPGGRLFAETTWIVRYLVPKLIRTARGRSSGDGCSAKRPGLSPIVGR